MGQNPYDALSKATSLTGPPKGPGEIIGLGAPGRLMDRLAEMLTQGTFSEEPGPVDLLMAGMGIPLSSMKALFRTGAIADQLVQKSPSRILRTLHADPSILQAEGSPIVAEIASGVPPRAGIGVTAGARELLLARQGGQSSHIPVGGSFDLPKIPGWEKRLAQDEMYRITQKLLDHLGIPENEAIDVFRGGDLYNQGHVLTPASVDPKIASGFNLIADKYEVPRKSVRALPGVLRRGDDVTLSELLIPSIDLKRSYKGAEIVDYPDPLFADFLREASKAKGGPSMRDFYEGATQRIPSRMRRIVAKPK